MNPCVALLPSFVMLSLYISACSKEAPKISIASRGSSESVDVAGVLAGTSWKANIYNNSTGTAYTGFNGSTVFKFLIGVSVDPEFPDIDNLSEAQVSEIFESPEFKQASLAESSKLSLEADNAFFKASTREESFARIYELTTLKAGTTSIKIRYATQEMPIAVQIAAYSAAQVAAGQQRYTTAVTGANPSPSCASCHRAEQGVDHSPYVMSQYSDGALLSMIEIGVNSDSKYEALEPHKMTFSSAVEKEGIVSYLRSLDPDAAR